MPPQLPLLQALSSSPARGRTFSPPARLGDDNDVANEVEVLRAVKHNLEEPQRGMGLN